MKGQPRKTIMFIVDSFNPGALRRALDRKMVPAMEFLKSRGFFTDRCVSVFPTMTPTCASTIATGAPPSDHLVPGFVWFSRRERRIVNYGISPLAVRKMGVRRVIQDLLFNLNHIQLSRKVKTLYESLEEAGYTTGAVNPFIFRAGRPHRARIPLLVQILSAFGLGGKIWGPRKLYLGQICPPDAPEGKILTVLHCLRKFGVNDDYSGTVGRWLISRGHQPDLLTIYLPDTDGYAHRHDPGRSEESLRRVDRQVSKILGAFPSWDEALRRNTVILVGDHSQSRVGTGAGSTVNLGRELREFSQLDIGGENGPPRDISVCVNERMCHVYILRDRERLLPVLAERIPGVAGVDQVAWKERDWYHLVQAGGKRLSFRPGRDYWDEYGQGWALAGDPGAAGARLDGHRIVFGDYPDALAQIANLLSCENAGDLVVTARAGFEFTGEYGPSHQGCGSHGSLHRDDSLVPLFVAGAPFHASRPRILDLAPYIRSQFGLA
ncbi:MAG: alkaline phosphatase family protein [Peptococcaceae bacterium]|nr:alkaline phosphatase family protein [Peptococcaceae bacterium]